MEQGTTRPSITITLSIETLERIRALGGDTDEDTIVQALGVLEDSQLEDAQFWAQADAAAAWEASLPEEERQALIAREAEVDAAFDGIE
jgi:hypothetical protein